MPPRIEVPKVYRATVMPNFGAIVVRFRGGVLGSRAGSAAHSTLRDVLPLMPSPPRIPEHGLIVTKDKAPCPRPRRDKRSAMLERGRAVTNTDISQTRLDPCEASTRTFPDLEA